MFSYDSSYFYLIFNNVMLMFYSRQLSNERSDNNKASSDHIVSIPTSILSNLYHLLFTTNDAHSLATTLYF